MHKSIGCAGKLRKGKPGQKSDPVFWTYSIVYFS